MSQARDDRRFRKAFGDVDESVEIDALRRRVTTLLDEVTEGAFQLQLAGLFDDGYNIGDEAGNYLIKAGSAGDKKRLAELMLRAQQKKKFLDAMKILAERKSVSSDPEVLRAEARKVGPDEPSPEQLADLILALQKGFGIKELKGDLGPKALRRLFVLLDGLPKPNTASLDMISEIKRVGSDSTSWFRPSDKAIELHVESLKPDVTKSYETPSGEILKLPKFDAVALHEIGHALDHAVGFMATKGKDPQYGGWEETTTAGIVATLAGTFKASAAATVLGWEDAVLGDFLASCLKKGTINPDLFPDGQVPAAVASDPHRKLVHEDGPGRVATERVRQDDGRGARPRRRGVRPGRWRQMVALSSRRTQQPSEQLPVPCACGVVRRSLRGLGAQTIAAKPSVL